MYGDFLAGREAALSVTLQRGAATAEISLPRIIHTANGLGLPGSHERRIVEEVEFLALGSLDGATGAGGDRVGGVGSRWSVVDRGEPEAGAGSPGYEEEK